MRRIILSALLAVSFAGIAHGQLSTDEATAKLKAKQEARDADRNKLVTITQGELDDMKAKIANLEKELLTLKVAQAAQAGAPAPPDNSDIVAVQQGGPKTVVATPTRQRFILEVKVGVTRQQLETFVAQHKDRYRIAKDVRQPDKQELITLEHFKMQHAKVGTSTNGVQTFNDYEDKKVADTVWELVLVNDVVTDMAETLGTGPAR